MQSVLACHWALQQCGVLVRQRIESRDERLARHAGVLGGSESLYRKPVLSAPGTRDVLVCAAGWRSALAAQTMQQTGLDDDGGFTAW
jgi:rhodanese-related sulfurtransferase